MKYPKVWILKQIIVSYSFKKINDSYVDSVQKVYFCYKSRQINSSAWRVNCSPNTITKID